MSILIEAINVVIKIDSLKKVFGTDLEAFYELIPNQSSYQDKKLIRVGFMVEKDMLSFIDVITEKGIRLFNENEYFDDCAIIYQGHDLTNECTWLERFIIEVENKNLEVCAYKDSSGHIFYEKDKNAFVCSEDWSVEGAIQLHEDGLAKYLRTEVSKDGVLDLYFDKKGDIQYIGREKRWFDLPILCLLRMPLRLSLMMSIIGVILFPLIAPSEGTLSSKIVWGFFIGGLMGLVLSSQYAKEFPMTPAWIRSLLGG